jgi:hypothetical protein
MGKALLASWSRRVCQKVMNEVTGDKLVGGQRTRGFIIRKMVKG